MGRKKGGKAMGATFEDAQTESIDVNGTPFRAAAGS
jgi:hypothetical protein